VAKPPQELRSTLYEGIRPAHRHPPPTSEHVPEAHETVIGLRPEKDPGYAPRFSGFRKGGPTSRVKADKRGRGPYGDG
jgi:hypothetical protein